MANFKLAAWKLCNFIKKYGDSDPTFAVFCVTHKETIKKGELIKKYTSEIRGGMNTAEINSESIRMNFKLKLLHQSGSTICNKDARKFFHYLENANLMVFDSNLMEHVKADSHGGYIETGIVVDGLYDVRATLRLTNDGIDFADSTLLSAFPVETTWAVSAMALVVSLFALAK